jgi:hypothetical protein
MSTAAALDKGPMARRFLNIVTKKFGGGSGSGSGSMYSVRRIDPNEHLFYPSAAEAQAAAARPVPWLERIQVLPPPKVKLQAYRSDDMRLDFLPFYGCSDGGESRILCTDPAGSTVICNAGDGSIDPVTRLTEPKGSSPVYFSVSLGKKAYDIDCKRADALYVLDRLPASYSPCNFEALIYKAKCWQWHQLPPPPYVNDPDHDFGAIQSYALLDGGTTVCISSAPVGTYCFDTATREWTKAGRWTMPFDGRAEHVPNRDRLFGFRFVSSERNQLLCATDLEGEVSDTVWEEEAPQQEHRGFEPDFAVSPVDRHSHHLAHLGSGRFCTARFYRHDGKRFAVFTGLEVDKGLNLVKHKSLRYNLDDDEPLHWVL